MDFDEILKWLGRFGTAQPSTVGLPQSRVGPDIEPQYAPQPVMQFAPALAEHGGRRHQTQGRFDPRVAEDSFTDWETSLRNDLKNYAGAV